MSAATQIVVAPIPPNRSRAGRVFRPTPEIDDKIRQAYSVKDRDRKAIKRLAESLRWNTWNIVHRAAELGISRTKEKPWSVAEVEILETYPWMSLGRLRVRLQRIGFTRSEIAINLKMKRLRVRAGIDGYSMTQLSEAFGVDTKQLRRWIKFGYIRGVRRGTNRTEAQGGDTWYFTKADVYRFVLAHPDEIELQKVEKFWFLDIVTNGKICR